MLTDRKIVLALIVLLLCAVPLYAQKRLVILHTNDTHSHVDPDKSGSEKGCGGVIERAAYIDSVRIAEGRRNVLLLDAGDFNQGTSYFSELKGMLEIDLLNAMKYDVVALGNHEFDNGPDDLAKRLERLDAKIVCANYDFHGHRLSKIVKPWCIVRRGGLKIGVFGLLTDVSSVVTKNYADMIEYQDPIAVADSMATMLREQKHCDLVICLSHIGVDENLIKRPSELDIAEKTDDIDIIVGGHTHTKIDDKLVRPNAKGKEVIIVTDWKFGYQTGCLTVEKQ